MRSRTPEETAGTSLPIMVWIEGPLAFRSRGPEPAGEAFLPNSERKRARYLPYINNTPRF